VGYPTIAAAFLSFGCNQEEGVYVFVSDMEKPHLTSAMVDDFFRLMYYSSHLFTPDIESIRRGYVAVAECQGMSMRKDVLKYMGKIQSKFFAYYPCYVRSRLFHTSVMLNMVVSMLKKMLPDSLQDVYEVGLQFEGHMGDVFLTPTVEEADARTLFNMIETLRLRYENEQSFSLIK
jgi:hypothetical protein